MKTFFATEFSYFKAERHHISYFKFFEMKYDGDMINKNYVFHKSLPQQVYKIVLLSANIPIDYELRWGTRWGTRPFLLFSIE